MQIQHSSYGRQHVSFHGQMNVKLTEASYSSGKIRCNTSSFRFFTFNHAYVDATPKNHFAKRVTTHMISMFLKYYQKYILLAWRWMIYCRIFCVRQFFGVTTYSASFSYLSNFIIYLLFVDLLSCNVFVLFSS